MSKESPEKTVSQKRDEYIVVQGGISWKGIVRQAGDRIEFARIGSHTNRDRWLKENKIRPLTEEEQEAPRPVKPRGRVGQQAIEAAALTQVQMIPLERIKPDPTQPRKSFEPAAMAELVESIKAHGVEQAILVRPRAADGKAVEPGGEIGWYEIVYGERRWRACELAGLTEIPAKVRDLSDIEAAEKQGIENLERADLLPLEVAAQYRKLLDLPGYGMERLMQVTGHAKNTIYGKLKLLELPEEARVAVERGELPEVTAEKLARLKGEVQSRAVKAVLHPPRHEVERSGSKVLTTRQTVETIKEIEEKIAEEQELVAMKVGAELRGLKWLEGEERERVMYWHDPRPESGYCVLKQTCPGDEKYRSYAQMLGSGPGKKAAKNLRPVAATSTAPSYKLELIELYDQKALRAALLEAGVEITNRRRADPAEAKRRAKDKVMKGTLDKAAEIIRLKAQSFAPRMVQTEEITEMWRALARCAARMASNDDLRYFVKRRGLVPVMRGENYGPNTPDFQQTLRQYIGGRSCMDIAGIVSELLLTAGAWWSHNDDFGEQFRLGARAFNVDLARLKKEQSRGAEKEAETAQDDDGDEEETQSASARNDAGTVREEEPALI